MLFTTSALSHIFPEIRVDAVRFIDLLLQLIPNTVVGNWISSSAETHGETSAQGAENGGRRILEGYLALLDIKGSTGGE